MRPGLFPMAAWLLVMAGAGPVGHAATAVQTGQGMNSVERFVGSGVVRATDLQNLPLLRERLGSGGPVSSHLRERLPASVQASLREVGANTWDPRVADLVAAALDQLLDDDRLHALRPALARQLPDGLDAWLAQSPPYQHRRRLGRCMLDVGLAPALIPSGPVAFRNELSGDGRPWRRRLQFVVPGWSLLQVDAEGGHVAWAMVAPPARARPALALASDVMALTRTWLKDRGLEPPEGAVWSPPRLETPTVARGEPNWELAWRQYAQGVRLPSHGCVVVSAQGYVTRYEREVAAVTIPLVPRVSVVEAFSLAVQAEPSAAFRRSDLYVWVREAGQSLIWMIDDESALTSVTIDAVTGELLGVSRTRPPAP